MPQANIIYFQDPISETASKLQLFHDSTIILLFFVLGFVATLITKSLKNKKIFLSGNTHHTVEVVWTLIPTVSLLFVGVSSLNLLYEADESADSSLVVVKATASQWFWNYETTSAFSREPSGTEAYINYEDLYPRLLNADESLLLPAQTPILFMATSSDVLHSWTVPALGVKIDACPGRLNSIIIQASRLGDFYGQCSEICGVNHSFIPIVVSFIPAQNYLLQTCR